MSKFVCFLLSLIASMVFFCFSCTNDSEAPRLERIAKAYCDCVAASELQSLNDKAVNEAENLTETETIQLFEDLQSEDNSVRECVGTITSNLGKIKGSEIDSLRQIFPEHCPQVARNQQFIKEYLGE